VTPAQTLMVIVPSDSQLEIEAMVSNRDVGFVHAGDLHLVVEVGAVTQAADHDGGAGPARRG